jgi:methylase of polypeptide subunit release factors
MEAKKFLTDYGKIFLEIGFGQKEEVVEIFAQQEFSLIQSSFDLPGVERVLEFSSNAR